MFAVPLLPAVFPLPVVASLGTPLEMCRSPEFFVLSVHPIFPDALQRLLSLSFLYPKQMEK